MADRIIILVSIDVAVKNRTDNTLGFPSVLSVLFFVLLRQVAFPLLKALYWS